MEPPIAVPYPHGCQFPQALAQGCLISDLTAVATTRAGYSRHPAGTPLTDAEADPEELHHGTLLGRLHPLFRNTSCSNRLSTVRSATSCLSRRFSSSTSPSRRSSATTVLATTHFHREQVCAVFPSLRQT